MLWDLPVLFPDAAAEVVAFGLQPRVEVVDGFTLEELSHLSRYAPALGESTAPMRDQLRQWLRAFAPPEAELAVEAGCSVGSELRILRQFARRVFGFDVSPSALRLAAAQLAGRPFAHRDRIEGRSFEHHSDWQLPAVADVLVALASVLAPPVRDGAADIVLALNLLDNVAAPIEALARLDAMLKPGGLLIIGSPFAWRDDITPVEAQLGGGTVPAMAAMGSPASLKAILAGETPLLPTLRHEVLATSEVSWRLRDHARCEIHYEVHMIATRKGAAP